MKRLFLIFAAIATISISAQAKLFPYSGGSGTADDPYRIATADDLLELSSSTAHYDANFVVTADINLSSYTGTTAVIARDTDNATAGFQGIAFSGVFNGNGHKISNLTINTAGAGSYYLGLFGNINEGEVKNIRLENVSITGGDGSFYIGGLAGINNSGTISNCSSTGTVAGGAGSYYIGGLAGYNYYSDISRCCSQAIVSGKSGSYKLGGLLGYTAGTILAYVSNCYATGDVSGHSAVGGLVGHSSQGNIINCYSTGDVKGTYSVGGLVGLSEYAISITDCYFLDESGLDNGVGKPLTEEEMKQQASFVGWDFVGEKENGKEEIWAIMEDIDYPRLDWVYVTKCTVTAGKGDKGDKITVSGQLDTGANSAFINGNVIEITVKSDHMKYYFEPSFDINDKTFKKGKYSYSGTEKGVKRSFKYDTKTRKFTLSASNVDLSGLDSDIMMHIDIGEYRRTTEFGEEIVNGKKPMPMSLMMGVEDALRVDKIKVKQSTKPNRDQLTVKGSFAMENTGLNLADWDLNITLNGEPYTIEAGKLIATKNGFGCKNVTLGDGFSIGSVDFNFKTASFKATIKKTEIDDGLGGLIDFGIMFGDYEENVDVELP